MHRFDRYSRAAVIVGMTLAASACAKSNPDYGRDDDDDGGGTGDSTSTSTSTFTSTSTSSGPTSSTSSTGSSGTTTTASTGGAREGFRIDLTVSALDAGSSAEPLAEVPLLIRLTPERLNYDASTPDGSELRFFNGSTQGLVPHEIERWAPGGTSFVWVRLPLVSVSEETDFWLEYGTTEQLDALPPTDVWSNGYIGVWHFADASGSTVFADSTEFGHDWGQDAMSEFQLPVLDERLGQAVTFLDDGTPRPRVLDTPALDLVDVLTISALVSPATDEPLDTAMLHRCALSRNNAYRLCPLHYAQNAPFLGLTNQGGMADVFGNAFGNAIIVDAWASLVGTYGNNEVSLYQDGQLVDSSMFNPGARATNVDLVLASRYEGTLDELRLAEAHRSAEWIQLQNMSLSDQLVQYGQAMPLQ